MVDQVLFKFKEYVQLWLTNGNIPNTNPPMIQYNTKIYKGATNVIDFVVRNNDRKPVSLVGYQIDALIERVENPELLLTKPVMATSDTEGKAQLTLLPNEIETWYGGFYRYTIRLTDITGKQSYLYTDVNRSTYNTFELLEGLQQALAPATQVLNKQFTPYSVAYYNSAAPNAPLPEHDYMNVWTTGALAGDAQKMQANGMHTVVAYTSGHFLGRFWIQGSLSVNAPQETDWFDIPLTPSTKYFSYTPDNSPKIQAFNFTGNYYWIRIFYQTDPINTGFFDKVLYKA